MKRAKLVLGAILFIFLVFGTTRSYSQSLLGSQMAENFELFSPITNGTFMGEGDDPWYEIGMPFTFRYDNQNITKLYVYGNGYISLNTYREPTALAIPKLFSYPNIISWYAADLVTEGGLYYAVTGSAPFRVLTIEQKDARTYNNGGGATFDVQIKFYETSNEIKIQYGDNEGLGAKYTYGWIYFTGSVASNYINVQPNDPNDPSTFYYSNVNPNISRFILADAPFKIPKGRTYSLKVLPSLIKVNPDGKYILTKDYIYSDAINHPYVLISREDAQYPVALRYTITGPIGSDNPQTIYTAIQDINNPDDEVVNFNPQPVGPAYRFDIAAAKGIAAGDNGSLDLKTKQDLIEGGLYEVTATLEIEGYPALNQTVKSRFYIALDYDLEATRILQPVKKEASAYRYGDHSVPLTVRITNVGKKDISYFEVQAKIYNATSNQLVSTKNEIWQNQLDPLSRNEWVDISLEDFDPQYIGDYYVTYKVTPSQYTPDGNLINNDIPLAVDPKHVFEVAYEIEAAITQVLAPSSTSYANVPIRPGFRIFNFGATDISNLTTTVTISKNNVVVYSKTGLIEALPSGEGNAIDYYFDDVFIPQTTGTYVISFKAPVTGDEIPSNNTLNYSFNVSSGLAGNYTIGVGGNFATIQDAVDAMYKKGITAPVTFKFISNYYEVGYSYNTTAPAIDMTSNIPGMSATNTVTFKASENISTRGYVKIYIKSGSGIGFLFGQNINPENLEAPINKATDTRKKDLANNAGYITFDGGELYTIQVIMQSPNNKVRVPFYLGNGASNISIKNLLISDANPLFLTQIPSITYNAGALVEFNHQPINNFSSAFLVRSVPPFDPKTNSNTYKIDTLTNKDNKIIGNVVNGFGFGLVDLGIGLLKEGLTDNTLKFFNSNNLVEKNTFVNLGGAGIFAGFADNSSYNHNRIDLVQNNILETAGIRMGGLQTKNYFGYFNTNITINGNEISNIKSPVGAAGIFVEQAGFTFGTGSATVFYPNTDDNFIITNNVIRDLNATTTNTDLLGIAVLTNRTDIGNAAYFTNPPKSTDYRIQNTKIANNTIIINDANEEFLLNDGEIAGIAVLQAQNTSVINNAVAIKDGLVKAGNEITAAMFVYGMQPNDDQNTFNNNVYYTKGSANVDLVRFIETNQNSDVVEFGVPTEFTRLDQWTAWTGQEKTSVEIYDFTQDLTIYPGNPNKLRSKNNPVPFGSSLDGRGLTLDYVQYDIDGVLRGDAGHRYDVGAEQFTGTPYVVDVESINFTEPLVYRATEGLPFDDAQYIVTQVPVEVKAQFRNNGTQLQSGVVATLTITRESNANRFDNGTVVLTKQINVNDLIAGEVAELSFDLADGIPDDFIPKTYSDFDGTPDEYTNIPAQFVKMKANVTPRYLMSIDLQYDQNNLNNQISQVVRFFLQRSRYKMLISTEDWANIDATISGANQVAANLNLDSLQAGLFRLGFYNNLNLENPRYDYDVIDRKAWERRSIDYSLYKTMFWVDGHDEVAPGVLNQLSIYEYRNLLDFLNTGNALLGNKKNIFLSSQDFVRNNEPLYEDFSDYFHATESAVLPTPLKAPADNYAGNGLDGTYIGRLQKFPVTETFFEINNAATYPNNYPMPGLLDIQVVGNGVARIGMLYDNVWFDNRVYSKIELVPENLKIAAITNNAVDFNLALIGVEWRHFAGIESVLRSMIDYADANEGYVVPIDLLSFNAKQVGTNSVALNWTTASEVNGLRFDIERSTDNANTFTKIGEEQTKGNSGTISHYGPFVDKNLNLNQTYDYRLKMIDKNGSYEYSQVNSVTLTGNEGVVSVSEFEPNPANSISYLNVDLSSNANVSVALYNVDGSFVANLFEGELSAGTKSIELNVNQIANGSYNAIITINGITFVKRINIVK